MAFQMNFFKVFFKCLRDLNKNKYICNFFFLHYGFIYYIEYYNDAGKYYIMIYVLDT